MATYSIIGLGDMGSAIAAQFVRSELDVGVVATPGAEAVARCTELPGLVQCGTAAG